MTKTEAYLYRLKRAQLEGVCSRPAGNDWDAYAIRVQAWNNLFRANHGDSVPSEKRIALRDLLHGAGMFGASGGHDISAHL